jgi:hypothetical protein
MRRRTARTAVAAAALTLSLMASGQAGAQAAGLTAEPTGGGAPASTQTGAGPSTTTGTSGAMPMPESTPAMTAEESLSNEVTLTTWAHPVEEMSIFAQPDLHSRRIARTHLLTEDGFLEVYMLLATRTVDGESWVKVRIPGRPNGREGWVLREALGGFQRTHWRIVVDLARRRLTAYYEGRRRLVAPVGVGKPSTPTPTGHFWIRERFKLTSPSSPYWPYALGTSDYSTLSEWPGGGVVGIHGDFGEPQKIPGDPSHGCIRMHGSDLAWLAPRITLGTPVDIIS